MARQTSKFLSLCFLILLACGDDPNPAATFSIRGSVTENGQGVSGISILMNSQPATTTSSNGSYVIADLEPASYIIKPEQAGRTFAPAELSVTISNGDSEGNNFSRVAANQIVHKDQEWTLFNPNVYSVEVNNTNALQVDLIQNALWYQGSQGGLIYRTVTGDFTMTATVNAVRKSDNNQAVACNVCLGGLMARNPSDASGQNYVHLVTGNTPNGLGYEVKNTTNSVSPYEAFGDGSTKHDLRIVRTGSTFTLYQKLSTANTWNVAATFSRPDLHTTLQVGVNIYTASGGAVADLSVIYENIVIE
jgi:hypothetical protein